MVSGPIFVINSQSFIYYLLHIGIKRHVLQHAFGFIFVPETKLLLTLFICPTPPHDCLQFHDFTYCAVAVLVVVVMAVIVYFPFLTFCSTNRTCFLTTKEQTYSKINATFHSCICIFFKERAKKGLQ